MPDKANMYLLKLDFYGTQGAYHALMNTEVKGRSAARNHDRVMKAIKTSCMRMRSEVDGDFIGGDITLDEDRFKYLQEIARKKIETGVPGSVGEAYCALTEELDNADLAVKAAAKAAEPAKA